MPRSAVVLIASLAALAALVPSAAAEVPPRNIRPTDSPPMEGRPRPGPPTGVPGVTTPPVPVGPASPARLPSTATAPRASGHSPHQVSVRPAIAAAFTAVSRTVTVVFGCDELGDVSPVAVNE